MKFTPAGGHITVRLARDREYVLTVSDTGIGIDPAFLPHIFTLFRQADASPSRQHGGLGLGLAIVRQLVELHGGTVAAHSEGIGRGSTVEVRLPSVLPIEDARIQPAAEPSARPAEPQRSDLLAGVDVLVVDDDEDARDLLRTTLTGYGANVTIAGSAADAMRAFERAVPDVLVSDIGMATEDGYSLMRRIRARAPAAGGQVPAVALTFEPSELAALVHKLTGTRLRASRVEPCSGLIQELLQRVEVCRKKELVLVAPGGLFRFDDVQQPRRRHDGGFDVEFSTRRPDRVEVEPAHHERQVNDEIVRAARPGDRAARDHSFRKPHVVRTIERLVAGAQRESEIGAGSPGFDKIGSVERQEEVEILRGEDGLTGRTVEICARNADHEVSDAALLQGMRERSEWMRHRTGRGVTRARHAR
ncbi:MAG: response regulator [Acidobacteria bacterium]|nr:response regulator [Acidobacteriota bacterium]